jgi:hypothetical protein
VKEITLKTDRLILRRFSIDDAEDYFGRKRSAE